LPSRAAAPATHQPPLPIARRADANRKAGGTIVFKTTLAGFAALYRPIVPFYS